MSRSGHVWNEKGVEHPSHVGIYDYICNECGFILDYVDVNLQWCLESLWQSRKKCGLFDDYLVCNEFVIQQVLES